MPFGALQLQEQPERREIENRQFDIHDARDPADRFGVNRMDRKTHCCDQAESLVRGQRSSNLIHQPYDHAVQKNADEMKTVRRGAEELERQQKTEIHQGAVIVSARLGHRKDL